MSTLGKDDATNRVNGREVNGEGYGGLVNKKVVDTGSFSECIELFLVIQRK